MQFKKLSLIDPEPVTLSDAKLFTRVNSSSDDSLLTSLITTAREMAEEYLGRSVVRQSYQMIFDDKISGAVKLLRPPVISINSVKTSAKDGAETTVNSDFYYLNTNDELVFEQYISGHKIIIEYNAGYDEIPEPIKQGMLNHIAALYDDRANTEIPLSSVSLYQPYRIIKL